MKEKILLLVCLFSVAISNAQDISPNQVLEVLTLNTTLDNIYYDIFVLNYGKPHEIEKNENDDGNTFKYEFLNEQKTSLIGINFITNSYGKITSILYFFPEGSRKNIIEHLNNKLSIINSKTWCNTTNRITYGLLKLSDIDSTSYEWNPEFLFLTNQM
ncbi:hypothetical protein [Flavobacterium oreochromis]|uniref:hypothetical protein n=1 Tax=Flavobacterium oreochromis TaxID=2906078 RepID=UPI00385CE162